MKIAISSGDVVIPLEGETKRRVPVAVNVVAMDILKHFSRTPRGPGRMNTIEEDLELMAGNEKWQPK